MCILNTPVEDYTREFGLYVKREDLCCPPGPHFSKTRGVFAHIQKRSERVIGVLDTSHSQGGWAVAQACALLGKHCVLYYPVRKADRETEMGWDPTGRGLWGDVLREPQLEAERLGAALIPLEAGRSAILYHRAKEDLSSETDDGPYGGYMMPNALKLQETVTETMAEFGRTKLPDVRTIIVSASSATVAAGVYLGALKLDWRGRVVVHLGYSRPKLAVLKYIQYYKEMLEPGRLALEPVWSSHGRAKVHMVVVDEEYGYADEAKPGVVPPFQCNKFYDLKTFRWWLSVGQKEYGKALLWNIG
jgi:hypothetical protein